MVCGPAAGVGARVALAAPFFGGSVRRGMPASFTTQLPADASVVRSIHCGLSSSGDERSVESAAIAAGLVARMVRIIKWGSFIKPLIVIVGSRRSSISSVAFFDVDLGSSQRKSYRHRHSSAQHWQPARRRLQTMGRPLWGGLSLGCNPRRYPVWARRQPVWRQQWISGLCQCACVSSSCTCLIEYGSWISHSDSCVSKAASSMVK